MRACRPIFDLDDRRCTTARVSITRVFNGLRWMVRSGETWRMMPNDLPLWNIVYQQMQRWIKAQVFEVIANDLRAVLRIVEGRNE